MLLYIPYIYAHSQCHCISVDLWFPEIICKAATGTIRHKMYEQIPAAYTPNTY